MADYSESWRAHRFWRRLPLIGMVFAFVFIFAAGQFPALQALDPLFPFVWLALVVCFVLANIKLATFKCPRCHQRFNANILGGGFALRSNAGRACGNCGLLLYEDA